MPGAEGPGDVIFAQVADDARQHDRNHQQHRGGQFGVLMGRTQVAQYPRAKAGPSSLGLCPAGVGI